MKYTLLCFLVLVCSCNTNYKPDLKRLHSSAIEYSEQPPVIFIPGITGSRLKDISTDKEIWPQGFWQLLAHDFSEVATTIDPNSLEAITEQQLAYSITDRVAGKDFYNKLTNVLEHIAGFKKNTPGKPLKDVRNYYIFPYDWRQDNAKTAKKLHNFIETIRSDYKNPNLKVDIIAHSMGGLIARYYLRYGAEDVLNSNELPVNLNGAKNLRRVILLGTPNFGSIGSINTMNEGLPLIFDSIAPQTLATMPSMYQLFPHALNDWIINYDGQPLKRDQFDVDLWRHFEWSIFNPKIKQQIISKEGPEYYEVLTRFFEKHLERARRFSWSLSVPYEKTSTKLIAFGGDCHLTPARVIIEETAKGSILRMSPSAIKNKIKGIDYDKIMLEPGDGTVTKSSLLARHSLDPSVARHKYSFFPIDYSFFLCEEHNQLTGNIYFQDNLLHVLLSKDL